MTAHSLGISYTRLVVIGLLLSPCKLRCCSAQDALPSVAYRQILGGSSCPTGFEHAHPIWCREVGAPMRNLSHFVPSALRVRQGESLSFSACVVWRRRSIFFNMSTLEYASLPIESIGRTRCPTRAFFCMCIASGSFAQRFRSIDESSTQQWVPDEFRMDPVDTTTGEAHLPEYLRAQPLTPLAFCPVANASSPDFPGAVSGSDATNEECGFSVGIVRCEPSEGACLLEAANGGVIDRDCLSIRGVLDAQTTWHQLALSGTCSWPNHTQATSLLDCLDTEFISQTAIQQLVDFVVDVSASKLILKSTRMVASSANFTVAPSPLPSDCQLMIPLAAGSQATLDVDSSEIWISPAERGRLVSAVGSDGGSRRRVDALEARSTATYSHGPISCTLDSVCYDVPTQTWASCQDGNLMGEFRVIESLYLTMVNDDSHDAYTCAVETNPHYYCLDIASYDNPTITYNASISSSGELYNIYIPTTFTTNQVFGQASMCAGSVVGDGVINAHDISLLIELIVNRDAIVQGTDDPTALVTSLQVRTGVPERCATNETLLSYLQVHKLDACAYVNTSLQAMLEAESARAYDTNVRRSLVPNVHDLYINTRLWITHESVGSWYIVEFAHAHMSLELIIHGIPWPTEFQIAQLSNSAVPSDGSVPTDGSRDEVHIRFARHCEYDSGAGRCSAQCSAVSASIERFALVRHILSVRQSSPACAFDLYIWVPASDVATRRRLQSTTVNSSDGGVCVVDGTAQPSRTCTPSSCTCGTTSLRNGFSPVQPPQPPPTIPHRLPPDAPSPVAPLQHPSPSIPLPHKGDGVSLSFILMLAGCMVLSFVLNAWRTYRA